MFKRLTCLLLLLPFLVPTFSQSHQRYGYWFDDDWEHRTVVAGTDDEISLSLPVSGMTSGLHAFYFRMQDTEGHWGTPSRFLFFLPEVPDPNAVLTQYEYWVDDDFSGRTTVNDGSGEYLISVPTDGLTAGLHTFTFRARNSQGVWGIPSRFLFFLPEVPDPNAVLTQYEYWVDNDFSGRTTVNDGSGEYLISVPTDGLTAGLHTFTFRARNSQGVWGIPSCFLFFLPEVPDPNAVLTQYEYWVDDDFTGRATVNDGSGEYLISVPTDGLTAGLHTFTFRARNSQGVWGTPSRFLFFLPEVPDPNAVLTQYEYWVDDDFSGRTTVNDGSGEYTVTIPTEGLTPGIHFFHFRARNSEGVQGIVHRTPFYLSEEDGLTPSSITGLRYGFNETGYWEEVSPTAELSLNRTFDIPEPLEFAKVSDGVFSIDPVSGKVKMNRTSNVNFSLQFASDKGAWSAPLCTTFTMTDSIEKTPSDLAVQDYITLDKVSVGDFQAVKMEISEQKTYYLKSSQPCAILLLKNGTEYLREISSAQLLQTYSITLAPGTYHAIVHDMVRDATYPDAQLILRLMLTDNYVPTPVITYENEYISISCPQNGASVFYTTDGSRPTHESPLYSGPFLLNHNATVQAIATYEGLADSYVATYTVDSYKTLAPVIEFANLMIYMSCATEGASIRYTLDGSDPTGQSALYIEPFSLNRNCTIKATAQREGYNVSDITTFDLDVDNVKCVAPVIEAKDAWMTMTTLTDGATIHYTSDGTEPTAASAVYSGILTLSRNAVYKAIAVKKGLLDSPVTTFTVDWFKASLPAFKFEDGILTITCQTPGSVIHYEIGGTDPTVSSPVYTVPLALTDNNVVKAMAVADGFIDSDVASYYPQSFTCDTVTIAYDGRSIVLSCTTPDAVIHYSLDGTDPGESAPVYTGRIQLKTLCTVKAIAVKEQMNHSPVSTLALHAFYDGETLLMDKPGTIAEAFGWCGTSNLYALKAEGQMNGSDLARLRAVKALQHLDLSGIHLQGDSLPGKAFEGMNLISIALPKSLREVGHALFSQCGKLAAIQWKASVELTTEMLEGVDNPNLLLYVKMKSYAPVGIQNVIVNGTAPRIILSDNWVTNGNFYCPESFQATEISYEHMYSMQTVIGVTQGFETLTLPFDAQEIAHDTNGQMAPFALSANGRKPFWLYALGDSGFEKDSVIRANRAYIVSMPNNEAYIDAYNLAGHVTFTAYNTTVPVTQPMVSEYSTFQFVPCFQSRDKSDISALNIYQAYKGNPEGSVFVPALRNVLPFEACLMAGSSGVVSLSELISNPTSIEFPHRPDGFLNIWSEGNILHLESERETTVHILTPTGIRIRTVHLTSGVTTVEDLPAGIYLIGNQKITLQQ